MLITTSFHTFTLLLTLSIVPHLPTPAHDALGYGPVAGDVRVVSSGVLVAHDVDVVIPVEWNSGEQLVWMGEEDWALVPDDVLLALSSDVAARVDEEMAR